MKLVANFLVVLWGAAVLNSCDSKDSKDSVASASERKSVSTEGGQVVIEDLGDLEAFIDDDDRATITITMTKEEAGKILSIMRPESKSEKVLPAAKSPEKLVSKTPIPEMVPKPVTIPEIAAKPVMSEAKSKEMAARSVGNGLPAAPAQQDEGSVDNNKIEVVAVSKAASDQLPDSDGALPEGYPEKLEDPTTGSEFIWSSKKGVWVSEAFGDYLKGSSKQNASFCWILTQNSSGVDKGVIPKDWIYIPLSDRKSVVIAEKSRGAEISAAVGKLAAFIPTVSDVKTEKAMSVPESEVKNSGEMLSDAATTGKVATETKTLEKTSGQRPVSAAADTGAAPAISVVAATSPAESEKEEVATTAPFGAESGRMASTSPVTAPRLPAEEPARFRPVSEVMPIGAALPDGRRLVTFPEYETLPSLNPQQPASGPFIRAIRARKVGAQIQGQDSAGMTPNVSGASDQPGVPSANSKPVVRPTKITIKSRRVGKLWKHTQKEQPVQPEP